MTQRNMAIHWFLKGDEYLNRKSYKNARRAYKRVIEIDPQNENAWNNLGICLYALGSVENALGALRM
jgi:tetratricopeptide (TPR) repeat protein